MFTIYTRTPWIVQNYPSVKTAIAAGMKLGVPFDVFVKSGAVEWAWEQRP